MSDLLDETVTPDAAETPATIPENGSGETPPAAAEPEVKAAAETDAEAATPETETPPAAAQPEVEAAAETDAETTTPETETPETETPEAETPEAAAQPEIEAAAETATPEVEAATKTDAETPATEAETAPTVEAGSDTATDSPAASKSAGSKPAAAALPAELAEISKALAEKKSVKGQVIGWNKGGYHIAVGRTAAFCPVSQIEIGNPRSPKQYLDKTFSFRVIEIQKGGRRVVLSRSEALKTERSERASLVRELLKPGAEVEGKISSLTSFGAFVDLGGGIEGLVHVSEISRRRVEHPKDVLKKGHKVKVCVLKIEKGGQRISLSMKRLEPDPWDSVAKRFPVSSKFSGKVLRQTDFGLFVELEPGLEGLVHTSRLPLGCNLSDESLAVGKEVGGWIHEVESKRRRLSLSLREVASSNPWQGVTDRYTEGSIVKGRVERLTNFGVFIELEPGLTGLLPFALLPGSGGNPRRQYHAGKEVSVRVLSIDRSRKRISLGTEASKAEGSQQDYREYLKTQRSRGSSGGGSGSGGSGSGSGDGSAGATGLGTMASAFAKLKERQAS